MSITDITVRVGLMAGCALLALVLVGWRQPARNRVENHRPHDKGRPEPLVSTRQRIRRRALDLSALGGVALVVGVVVATLVSVVVSWIVTNIIDRL